MRVIVLVKASKDSEAGVIPPDAEEKWREMGQFNEELIKAGILVAAYGLHPSSKGEACPLRRKEAHGHRRPVHRDEGAGRRFLALEGQVDG